MKLAERLLDELTKANAEGFQRGLASLPGMQKGPLPPYKGCGWDAIWPGGKEAWRVATQAIIDALRSLADDPESGVAVVEAREIVLLELQSDYREAFIIEVSGPGRKLVLDWPKEEK